MVPRWRNLIDVLKRRRIDIAVIIGWSIAITLLIIRTYEAEYATNVRLAYHKVAYLHYEGATFTIMDQILIAAISFFAGILLTDIRSVVLGFFTNIFLSFALATAYIFNYIWYVLEYERILSHIPFGWEDAFLLAVVNVFRFMFPYGVLFTLLGITIGIFIRGLR